MKSSQFFSVIFSLSLLASMSPLAAMDDGQPTFNFEGIDKAAQDFYTTVKPHAIAGIEYVKDTYETQAPKISAAVTDIAKQVQEMVIGPVEPTLIAVQSPTDAIPPVIHAVPSVKFEAPVVVISKNPSWFSRVAADMNKVCFQAREYAKAHPVITGVAVAAVIAIPVIAYLYKTKKAKTPKIA